MFVYDFKCLDCGKELSATESVKKRERGGSEKCPECGKANVRQLLTAFTAKTSRKS